jgi:hypothetical protein
MEMETDMEQSQIQTNRFAQDDLVSLLELIALYIRERPTIRIYGLSGVAEVETQMGDMEWQADLFYTIGEV